MKLQLTVALIAIGIGSIVNGVYLFHKGDDANSGYVAILAVGLLLVAGIGAILVG